MKQKISLRELVRILDNYSRTNDFVRVVSLGPARHNGELYHGVWVEKTNGTEELIKIPYFEEKEIVLTKEEAIKRHRMMWNWIAYETLRREKMVGKKEAFEKFGWTYNPTATNCWCCEYVKDNHDGCESCPVQWVYTSICCDMNSLYSNWNLSSQIGDYKKAAEYAFQIANLPEREDV